MVDALLRSPLTSLAKCIADQCRGDIPVYRVVQLPAPASLTWPMPHATAVLLVEPAGHAYPAEHKPVQVALVSPVAFPNVPGGHSTHA